MKRIVYLMAIVVTALAMASCDNSNGNIPTDVTTVGWIGIDCDGQRLVEVGHEVCVSVQCEAVVGIS